MSLLRSVVQSTPDPVTLPGNERYQLILVKATLKSSKGGEDDQTGKMKKPRPMLVLTMKAADHPTAQLITEYPLFPIDKDTRAAFPNIADVEDDSEEMSYSWHLRIKDIVLSFGINIDTDGDVPYNEYSPDMEPVEIPGWKGKTAFAILGVDQSPDGRVTNNVKRWERPA